ncbi:hypothetical protein PANT111_90110 [Pantoea brenneri]|uniref:Uncharacterized protein n=1 Tax=Pantoea brenneri TaxID=472694 RepID=A0AAX3JDF7_9GAMM|nr:hypothetical protein PANT111_90110 [Pantoea brenneri]
MNCYQLIADRLAWFIFNKYLNLHIIIGAPVVVRSFFIGNQWVTAGRKDTDVNNLH